MGEELRATVRAIKASGITSLNAIAKALQDRGIRTPAGATTWHRAQVSRLLAGECDAAGRQLNGHSNVPPAGRSPASALVHVTITANHVPLPVEPDDTVGAGWASAERTTLVNRGRRLCVPPDLADILEYRRQAVRLSSH